jgi:hypothetical protein
MNHFKKKRRSAREIKQELRAIYAGRDGKLPDLTRLSQKKRSPMTAFLMKTIGILFLLSILAWSGFFLFTRGLFDNDETFAVTIETSDTIRVGEETALTIRYENTGDVPISALELKLNLPNSFHPISFLPEPEKELEWNIGSLTSRSDGAITINGIFLSEVPSIQRIQALFTYKPANFSSDFQVIESKSIEMKESTIKLTMTGPEKALAGDPVEYTLNIAHTGKKPVFNLRALLNLPANFVIASASPALNVEGPFWEIASLEPGKLMEIIVEGSFTSTAFGEIPMMARVGFMDEENFFEQAKAEMKTDVLGGAVSFHLIFDGSDKDQTVPTGKTLRGSIDFKNPGTEPAEGIGFTLTFSADKKLPIDWDKADLSDGKRTGNVIRWSKTERPELSKLDPGAEGIIDFTLPLVGTIGSGESDALTAALSMDVARVGSITNTRTIDATPIRLFINSNIALSAQARYFAEDGTPFGSGNLPPRVESTTSYRILWDISNSLHALGSVEVSTVLPQDVVWKDVTGKEIGTISYNPTTRQVRWQTSKLPSEIKNAEAWFDVSITPKKTDVGKFMKLTNQTALEAVDLVTKAEVNSTLPVLTTELSNDELASGKGVVEE